MSTNGRFGRSWEHFSDLSETFQRLSNLTTWRLENQCLSELLSKTSQSDPCQNESKQQKWTVSTAFVLKGLGSFKGRIKGSGSVAVGGAVGAVEEALSDPWTAIHQLLVFFVR